MTTIATRRSTRIANKPLKVYFSEDDEIAEAIQAICDKRGLEYSDELVEEFNYWRKNSPQDFTNKYDDCYNRFIPMTIQQLVNRWYKRFSTSLKHMENLNNLDRELINYCKQKGITYNSSLRRQLFEWVEDPANKNLIYYNIEISAPFNEVSYIFYYKPERTIKKWFASLKK